MEATEEPLGPRSTVRDGLDEAWLGSSSRTALRGGATSIFGAANLDVTMHAGCTPRTAWHISARCQPHRRHQAISPIDQ